MDSFNLGTTTIMSFSGRGQNLIFVYSKLLNSKWLHSQKGQLNGYTEHSSCSITKFVYTIKQFNKISNLLLPKKEFYFTYRIDYYNK